MRDGRPPEDADAAIEWLNRGAQLMIDAVERVGTERVWTFTGPRPAGWWIRRRVHEVAVHRIDAALAVGAPTDLAAELAADSLSEWIELATVDKSRAPAIDRGQTIHLHATDGELGPTGEWTIVHDDDGLWWSHSHGKGDVALRGPVNALLLATVRRTTADEAGLEVFGDSAVWDRWLDRTPF